MSDKELVERGGEVKLLPCPFCGSSAFGKSVPPIDAPIQRPWWWRIDCDGCEVAIERPTQAMAEKDWNRRTARTFLTEADKELLPTIHAFLESRNMFDLAEALNYLIERLTQQ